MLTMLPCVALVHGLAMAEEPEEGGAACVVLATGARDMVGRPGGS
jgi:hypothetical protein